jgi:hypothetical protein
MTIRTHSYRAILSAILLNPAITRAKEGTNSHSSHASFQKGHRDRHIQMIQEKGRTGWQKAVGYGKRALVETAMFRYKTLIGPTLRARKFAAQQVEARVACSVLNRMTQLGRPISQRVR